jgi:lipopolysaccharide export system permease protein
MHKITRYVSRTIFMAIAATLLVISALDFVFGLIGQFKNVSDTYTITEAVIYMTLVMPGHIYGFIPYACLIGVLAGLGLLAGTSELVIIRSAGVSIATIVWMALRPVLIFILTALLIGEFIAPYADRTAEARKDFIRHSWVKPLPENVWSREAGNFMYVQAVKPNGVLQGITRYQFDERHQLISASYTEHATYVNDQWQEHNILITQVDNQKGLIHSRIENRDWQTDMTPQLFNILASEPDELSMRDLHYYVNYLEHQKLTASSYSIAFWQKCLQPLAIISLVLIGISFIFGPLRSVTMSQRIFSGVVIGVIFLLLQKLLGPSSLVFGFSPLVAVLIPIFLCVAVGVVLLRRSA